MRRLSWCFLLLAFFLVGGLAESDDAPVVLAAQQIEAPWFRDATKEYGPIGAGAPAFADLDGDGFPELICDGKIYKNDGGKRFIDVTKESGIAGAGAACVADIDNDGLPDIYFCGGTGKLYRNLGKLHFEDWTSKIPPNKHARSLAAAFGATPTGKVPIRLRAPLEAT